jgi:hypothetical protein
MAVEDTDAPTAAPTTNAPTRQPTRAPSTAPTPSPTCAYVHTCTTEICCCPMCADRWVRMVCDAHTHALTHTNSPRSFPVTSQTNTCTVPANCVVAWSSDWSSCSAECGPGVQTQAGVVTQKPSINGAPCPESLMRTRPCSLRSCLGTAFLQAGGARGHSDVVNAQEKVVLGVDLPAAAASGRLLQPSDWTFKWSGGGGELDLAADAEAAASRLLTSTTDRYLAFKPRALQPGQAYEFACTVSNGVDQTTSKVCVCMLDTTNMVGQPHLFILHVFEPPTPILTATPTLTPNRSPSPSTSPQAAVPSQSSPPRRASPWRHPSSWPPRSGSIPRATIRSATASPWDPTT